MVKLVNIFILLNYASDLSSFGYFITTNGSLPATFVSAGAKFAEGGMFGLSALHPFAPHPERTGLHVASHQFNNLLFAQPELKGDCFKWRTVFPGHFNDAIDVRRT